jgi:hypothetical protein
MRTTSIAQQPVFSNRGVAGVYFGTTTGKFFVYYSTATPSAMVSSALVNDGKWHHIAWSNDGLTSIMYIDGKIDSKMAQTRAGGDSAPAYIGFDAPNSEYFSGDISGVAIYNCVLATLGC